MNKEVLSYYIYKLLRTVVFTLSFTFIPIYLYLDVWYSVAEVIFYSILVFFPLLLFAPFALRLINLIWVKKSIAIHVFWISFKFYTLQYLSWSFFDDIPLMVLTWIVLWALKSCYSTADNIFINERVLKHKDILWKSLSYIQILTILAWIIAPLVWWLFTYFYGFDSLFMVAMYAPLCTIPLFIWKDFKPQKNVWPKEVLDFTFSKMDKNLKKWVFWSSFSLSILQNVWPIFLIITVETTLNVGYLLSFSALIAVIISKYVWNLLDKEDFSKKYNISVNLMTFLYILRGVFPVPILLAVTDILNKVWWPLVNIPFDKYVFEYIKVHKDDRDLAINSFVLFEESIFLVWYLVAWSYFYIIENSIYSVTNLAFVIIFILYWSSILLFKNLTKVNLKEWIA